MTDLCRDFSPLLRLLEPRRVEAPWTDRELPGLTKARGMDTAALRRLWDSYDGEQTADPEICGEAVHYVLNERHDGHYCAV